MLSMMGTIVRIDSRGRLVIPAEFRSKVETNYFEVREDDGKLLLIPVPDPLSTLVGRVSRAKPLRDIGEAAEEEAERILREEKEHADTGG